MENTIFISAATWHEIRPKVKHKHLRNRLKSVDVTEYGDIFGVNFFFICKQKLKEEDIDQIQYDPKEKHINGWRVLDYLAMEIMNEEQIQEYMCKKFLDFIDYIKDLEIEFDHEKFREKIHNLLLTAEEA